MNRQSMVWPTGQSDPIAPALSGSIGVHNQEALPLTLRDNIALAKGATPQSAAHPVRRNPQRRIGTLSREPFGYELVGDEWLGQDD